MYKALLVIALVLCALETYAAQEFRILTRVENSNNTIYKQVLLEDLVSENSFEGTYYKIVKGKSKTAISFKDPDADLVLKAATVYYHLTRARRFWIESLSSGVPLSIPKIIVRLEITNLFDELGHFAHDNRDPQYNNALSIPAGETPEWVPADRKDKWNQEIWFRPRKTIDTRTLPNTSGPNPVTLALQSMDRTFVNYSQNQFTQNVMEHIFYPQFTSNSLQHDVLVFVGTIALTKAVLAASKRMDRLFLERWFYLDTAMVPEVIYHEYAHVILSDKLEMTHSTPVVEGMADYFAALLSGKNKVYGKVRGRSNSRPKDRQSKETYSHWKELNRFAAGDFVLAVLWDVRETLEPEVANKVIYEARQTLETDATINNHLLRAIFDSCEKHCPEPRRDQLKLYEKFSKRGF